MYINLINNDKYTTDRMEWHNFNSYACNQAMPSPETIAPLPIVPQVANTLGNFITDTLNWMEVKRHFYSNGSEAYLTIGNFMMMLVQLLRLLMLDKIILLFIFNR